MSIQDSAINIKEYTRPPDIYPLKVACSSKFSWSTNLESKLIEFFVLVNTVHFGSLQRFTVLKIGNVHAARKRCVCGCNLKKGRGRSKGTTRIKGYGVSPGRPVGTTAEEGTVLVQGDLWVQQQRRGMVFVQGDLGRTTAEEGTVLVQGDLWVPQ